jgi:hypothetical protein
MRIGTLARIFAHELDVDFEDAQQLLLDLLAGQVGDVEVDLVLALYPAPLVDAHIEDFACGDVARHEVAVGGILLLKEVPAVAFGDVARVSAVVRVLGNPHAPALAAHRLGNQAALVLARDGGRVNLDELAVGVVRALLVADARRAARADDGVGRVFEDHARSACGDDDRLLAEGTNLHRAQVLRDQPAADAVLVQNQPQELPAFVLGDAPFHLPAAHLLVQSVQQLLSCGRARERRAVVARAAEASEVDQALWGAVERHAHAIEQDR